MTHLRSFFHFFRFRLRGRLQKESSACSWKRLELKLKFENFAKVMTSSQEFSYWIWMSEGESELLVVVAKAFAEEARVLRS